MRELVYQDRDVAQAKPKQMESEQDAEQEDCVRTTNQRGAGRTWD